MGRGLSIWRELGRYGMRLRIISYERTGIGMYRIMDSEDGGEVVVFWDGRGTADCIGTFHVPLHEAFSLAERLGVPCGHDLGGALGGIDDVLRRIWDVVVGWDGETLPVDYGDLDDALVELSAYGTAFDGSLADVCGIIRLTLALTGDVS